MPSGLQDGGTSSRPRVYVWRGERASDEDAALATELAARLDPYAGEGSAPMEVLQVREGAEPLPIWRWLGGHKAHDNEADFLAHSRLFKCSNERGIPSAVTRSSVVSLSLKGRTHSCIR